MSTRSQVVGFGVGRKSSFGKAIIAAAVITTAAPMVSAGIIDVSSVKTQLVAGKSSAVNPDKGVATPGSYSGFTSSKSYNVSYGGIDDKLISVTGGGITYSASGMATSVSRRIVSSSNNDQLWYVGSGNASSSTLKLNGPSMTSFDSAFASNNLYIGADNIFSNTGNAVGNNSNVTRLDLVFGAFKASNLSAFTIFDRGANNDHDSFKIAAITAVDASGNPTNYGPLMSYSDGTWGKTNIMSTTEELILRKNDSSASNPFQPSDYTSQALGGVIVPTNTLVSSGTTIYGYSLFAASTTGSGTQLTQWTNTKYFPLANSTSTGGGLDPAATVAVLFTATPTVVPEPASVGLIAVAAAGLLGRRRKARIA